MNDSNSDAAALRQRLRIVLVEPSHPGNIGAAARAMANMGLEQLVLVKPRRYPDTAAVAMAAGADAVLDNAVVCADLDAAIGDCQLVIGTTARLRTIGWPLLTPGEAARQARAAALAHPVALVFGRERSGLTNAEVERCHRLVRIPVDDAFASLNLAAAVLVLVYELRQAVLAGRDATAALPPAETPATAAELRFFFDHLEGVLSEIGFLRNRPSTRLLRKLVRLFTRAEPSQTDINILRGVLSAVQQHRRG